MSPIHHAILSYVRREAGEELAAKITDIPDDEMVRLMFSNFRGIENKTRGMRLTRFGLTIMENFFCSYKSPMPEDDQLQPRYLLYLDANATMPYYCSVQDGYVLFESSFGIKLMLAGGKIGTLIAMDT